MASDTLTFRRAAADDAAALSTFARRMFDDVFGPDNDPGDMASYMDVAFSPDVQRRETTGASRACWIGEDAEGKIGAYLLMRTGKDEPCVTGPNPVEIERFYVDFPWHGTGVAQAMMTLAMDSARAMGGETLWLGVWERNPRAIKFYSKLGFTDVGEHEFVLGTDVQTDRIMSRAL